MDISVLGADGVDPDDILCISSGHARRMATVTSDKKLSFPPEAVDFKSIRGNPIKVEILKQVGKAYLVLKPREQQYKVLFNQGADAPASASVPAAQARESCCELLVQPRVDAEGNGLPAAAAGAASPLAETAAAAAEDAQEYLEAHRVLPFMQAVLHAMIKERPEDPFEYMARHFMSGYRHREERRPLPEGVVPIASVLAAAPMVTGQEEAAAEPAALPPAAPDAAGDSAGTSEPLPPPAALSGLSEPAALGAE